MDIPSSLRTISGNWRILLEIYRNIQYTFSRAFLAFFFVGLFVFKDIRIPGSLFDSFIVTRKYNFSEYIHVRSTTRYL